MRHYRAYSSSGEESSRWFSHRYLRVSLTTTPESSSREIRFGMAIKALVMSAIFQTRVRLSTLPANMATTHNNR